MPLVIALLAAVVVAIAGGGLAGAEESPPATAEAPTFQPGEVTERVACEIDPDRTYALYLPASYTPARRWPVVILMDPRGRALVPLDLFREAAERLGYVLVSSYDTASDGPREPNVLAMRAILPDIEKRIALDSRRLYLAGFSGTARFGWDLGVALGDNLAGHIGVGGGFPHSFTPPAEIGFAFFGAAGTTDFNYEEMRELDRKLDQLGVAHRIVFFDGTHQWPPAEVCGRALEWMELQAMKSGRRPRSDSLVEELFASRLVAARKLDAAGATMEAHRSYTALVAEFADLRDVEEVRARADELGKSEAVRVAVRQQEELIAERRAYDDRLTVVLQDINTADTPPPLARSLRTLQIKELKRRASGKDDPEDALAAQRLLQNVFTYTSFYEFRRYMDEKRYDRALAVLAIAGEVEPDSAQICLNEARAHAQLGHRKKGLAALSCVVDSGLVTTEFIEGDDLLAPLRKGDEYAEIMKELAPSP
jgi:predicted esterase